jgi:MYXO-CTERM domain-containing protein
MADDIGVSVRVVTILVAGLMFAGSARADEAPPPSFFACTDKSPGDACEGDFGAGACVASTCSRLDYSKGSPPETVSQDCLKCQPTPPTPTPPAPVQVAPVQSPPVQSPPTTAPTPEATRGACQIGHGAGAPALFLLALATLRRRRCR